MQNGLLLRLYETHRKKEREKNNITKVVFTNTWNPSEDDSQSIEIYISLYSIYKPVTEFNI
uniref:Uncharacterized protein n=1 Tax=Arion vulgaris TaxID=1028688 RepID=A0A0B7A3R6_9EUPU